MEGNRKEMFLMTTIPVIVPTRDSGTSQPLPAWLDYALYGVFTTVIMGITIFAIVEAIISIKEGDTGYGIFILLMIPLLIVLEIVLTYMVFF